MLHRHTTQNNKANTFVIIMEKRANTKVSVFLAEFKNAIKEKMMELNMTNTPECNSLMSFIYNYEIVEFSQEDFTKRKRVRNIVPLHDRCCALRANNEQCTRRKKEGEDYCGTHMKGTPNGMVASGDDGKENVGEPGSVCERVDVWAEEIMGITYYIDNQQNVYQTEDVLMNRDSPKIIAKYTKKEDGTYTIPDFGLVA